MITERISHMAVAAAAVFFFGAAQAQVEQDFIDPLEDAALDAEEKATQERTPGPSPSAPVTFGDLIRSGLAAGVSPRVTISIFGHPGPCPFCGVRDADAEAYKGASAPSRP
jgi:hypothetical protein